MLAATARLIGVDSLASLALLSGDMMIWNKIARFGGATCLYVPDEIALNCFLVTLPRFLSFSTLTHRCAGSSALDSAALAGDGAAPAHTLPFTPTSPR